tara:strand:- start:22282 stop:22776 length:495 start_codon:yes stop_codon:yes gene_type:complete
VKTLYKFNEFLLTETYYSNESDIINFIDELPNKIILYRGIIVPKDNDKLNKDKLGIHWSLDEDFVKNMIHYDTFDYGNEIEDYFLYIIESEFNKSDIDIEKTIDKRLITKKIFIDELSDEVIENDNMDYHPFEHEDEIVIKEESIGSILNITKIDLLKYLDNYL